MIELTRRQLLKALGGGMLVLAASPDAWTAMWAQRGGQQQIPQGINAWLHIAPDGKITVLTGKAEVGQNARTSITQAAAEELRVAPESITVTMADTDLVPFDIGTFGSRTTPTMLPQVRRAAAAAREALIDLAAEKWHVDRKTLEARDGKVTSVGAGRSLPANAQTAETQPSNHKPQATDHIASATYGELAKGMPLDKQIGSDIALTPSTEWKTMGTSVRKIGAENIVTGRHDYTSDLRRPGMLYAKVLRPPSFGATIATLDTAKAEAMPGVKVVRDGEFVGIAAPSLFAATGAIAAIQATWHEQAHPSQSDLSKILRSAGDPPTIATGEKSLKGTYAAAYIAHVPLEPRAALAEWDGQKMTVHTGTQRPFGVRDELVQALGLTPKQVRVIVPDTGSGYGGKHTGEAAIEAARIAKAVGKPVKLVWTRPEEFTFAYFRPAGIVEISSGCTGDGKLTAWTHDNYNSGPSAIDTPYDVANKRDQFHQAEAPLRQGSYRSLAACFNTFARETHMDELAHLLGQDPLQFRLNNINNPRLKAVLEALAEKLPWRGRPGRVPGMEISSEMERIELATAERPLECSNLFELSTAELAPLKADKAASAELQAGKAAGHGFGIACGTEKGSYVAAAAEVAVEDGAVHVIRAVIAYECGAIVNPGLLRNQVEGALIMGLGGALFEEIHFDKGKILTDRLSKYRVPRYADIPHIESILIDRKDLPSAGAGETPIIAIAPAIGNAIFNATGTRLRSLPLKLA